MVSAVGILEISTKANSRAFTVIFSPLPHVKIVSNRLGEPPSVQSRFPSFRESELIYFRSNSIVSSQRKIDRYRELEYGRIERMEC